MTANKPTHVCLNNVPLDWLVDAARLAQDFLAHDDQPLPFRKLRVKRTSPTHVVVWYEEEEPPNG